MENIKEIAEIEQRSRSNTRRIEVLEESTRELHELITSVALIAQKQETMEKGIEEIKTDVKALASKPGKRWESVVEIVFKVVLTALITAALVKIGF